MPKAKILTGVRFGKLIAIRPTVKRSGTSVVWECKCDCGNVCYVSSLRLTRGETESCGCAKKIVSPAKKRVNEDARRAMAKDLMGQRFGKLVVVRKTEQRISGNVVWECKCDCGNTTYVRGSTLRNGATRSCGCLWEEHKQRRQPDLTGMRFGKLTVLRETEGRIYGNVLWECKCDCGKTVLITRHSLNGGRKSCGCGRGRPKEVGVKGK